MELRFTIPGKPCGKQRPRFGNGRTYTPEQTVNYENLVKLCFRQAYPDHEPIAAGVAIVAEISAYYPIPKTASKARKAAMLGYEEFPCKKPDCDNVAKIVLDSLNEIAYHDDAQVVELRVFKAYSETPRVEVVLEL